MKKTNMMKQVEKDTGTDIVTLLTELSSAGVNRRQIAEKLELSPQVICNWFERLGIEPYNNNYIKAMAEETGLSKNTICSRIYGHGRKGEAVTSKPYEYRNGVKRRSSDSACR